MNLMSSAPTISRVRPPFVCATLTQRCARAGGRVRLVIVAASAPLSMAGCRAEATATRRSAQALGWKPDPAAAAAPARPDAPVCARRRCRLLPRLSIATTANRTVGRARLRRPAVRRPMATPISSERMPAAASALALASPDRFVGCQFELGDLPAFHRRSSRSTAQSARPASASFSSSTAAAFELNLAPYASKVVGVEAVVVFAAATQRQPLARPGDYVAAEPFIEVGDSRIQQAALALGGTDPRRPRASHLQIGSPASSSPPATSPSPAASSPLRVSGARQRHRLSAYDQAGRTATFYVLPFRRSHGQLRAITKLC